MKIVILADGIPPEGRGGAERIAWESAIGLAKQGHDVTVITTTQLQNSETESQREGVRIVTIPTNYHLRWRAWRALYNPRPVREVKRLLSEINPDLVHAHNVHQYLSYATLRVASRYRSHHPSVRIFHTIHDAMPFNYDKLTNFVDPQNLVCVEHPNYKTSAWKQLREQRLRYNPFRNFFIRRALRKVDRLLTVSHALSDALAQNGIRNVRVLYNGVDASEWNVSSEVVTAFKHRYGLEGKKVMLFGGRVTGTKGGDALLASLPKIISVEPETVLLIMGTENDYVRRLITRAQAAGISKNIVVTGWINGDDLRAAYHSANLVAVPSLYLDPLPTVVLEAMACGKPVVGSCFGGIPEMVQDGMTGYVVHPLNTEVLVEKCVTLLSNEALAETFGRAGRDRQELFFSKKRHQMELLQFYTDA